MSNNINQIPSERKFSQERLRIPNSKRKPQNLGKVPTLGNFSSLPNSPSPLSTATPTNSFTINKNLRPGSRPFGRGKPAIPPLWPKGQKTLESKQRTQLYSSNHDSDMYALVEFRKAEIRRSRQVPCARFPFWYIDPLFEDLGGMRGKLSSRAVLKPGDLSSANTSMIGNWIKEMSESCSTIKQDRD